ncbi:uncharacterized protein LOC112594595 isoform X2 [Melanaphis sacchari]|uniref:uncharacterized protein LOC112594595 isoform X2 n=1 Tax=Melanaphis sacchari TaxID=742174 RepID=UPI000DC12E0F|nr:uncharacterized protein LOC112594595 isoform X2 [Melanaphis sacchari]XP_025195251.1 uncharacterized protein LOC112594595 isoform X2 [Melanaphis sacchari]XP_025195252.1 uncharacterized protein LOC112594595 isoform X2 [Melanaphis sacchari]
MKIEEQYNIIRSTKMPKTKKKAINDKKQCPSKRTVSKRQSRSAFKFDIKKILKERRSEGKLLKQSAKLDEEMKIIDDLYQEKVNQTIDFEDNDKLPLVLKNLDRVIIDHSNYNIPFKDNLDVDSTKLCIQRLRIMSIEENEVEANIHFNHLMKANWSPEFGDVLNILYQWRADLDTPTTDPSLEYQNIGRHNFELVINFISYNILKNNEKFSVAELLTIAKYIVKISFDRLCGQMINVIKRLFSTCIETALKEDNNTTIMAFAQELYSKYNEDDLLDMIVNLFLPLEGQIMKKIYIYLTYKLYKSLLGKNDTCAFPSSIKEWFVQDFVDKNYFNKNPKKVLFSVIQLLEHVVVILDLYEEEEKLHKMYNFLNAALKPTGLSNSLKFINILDQWRLRLFRLHVNRKTSCK